MIRAFAKVGKAIGEDSDFVRGGQDASVKTHRRRAFLRSEGLTRTTTSRDVVSLRWSNLRWQFSATASSLWSMSQSVSTRTGKIARIAELLNQRTTCSTTLPGRKATFRRVTARRFAPVFPASLRALNEGVPRSKSSVSQFDEGAAMLEGFSEVDRKEAILSGDVAEFRLSEAAAFMER
jgi:hypothetical protein